MKISSSVSLVLFQIFYSTCFTLNPWAGPENAFNFPTYKNPVLKAPYKACAKDTYGVMTQVEVNPCEDKERCPLVRGSNVTLKLEFIPSFPATTVVGSLAGVLNSYFPSIPFGKPEDLCEQIKCPLIPNQVYQYRSTIFVKQEYPRLKLDAKVQVHGDNKEIACALISVQIVDPPKAPSS